MSYCRWSSDNWKSDVYAYESRAGYEVYVATNRYTSEIPAVPTIGSVPNGEWLSAYQAQMKAVHNAESKKIGGEYDGKFFLFDTLEQFYAGLKDIQAKGYHVPPFVFDEIQAEMSEIQK